LLRSDQLEVGGCGVGVIIGMGPRQRSATVEVVDERGRVVATGRLGTDRAGYAEMLHAGREHGIGQHIAHRLVHDGRSQTARRWPIRTTRV
jgi:transposase